MKNRKFRSKVTMESVLQKDGSRKVFKPGDIIEEQYISPDSIEQYLKGGIIEEIKDTYGSSGRNPKEDNSII